jgi:hypothetical protein
MFDRDNVIHLYEKAGFSPTEWRPHDAQLDRQA